MTFIDIPDEPRYDLRINLTRKSVRTWNLAEASLFVSAMQQEAHDAGWNLSIGGGVLNNGYSENDLDLVAVARTTVHSQSLSTLLYLFQTREFFMQRHKKHVHIGTLYGAERHDGKSIELLVIGG